MLLPCHDKRLHTRMRATSPTEDHHTRRKGPSVAVVGAGAFGGWTALHLLRQGAWVTLFDAWGPGNARSSSGGETRIMRAIYGPDRVYVEMVKRSLELWRDNEARWNRKLYHQIAMLWLAGNDEDYERAAVRLLGEAVLGHEELSARASGQFFWIGAAGRGSQASQAGQTRRHLISVSACGREFREGAPTAETLKL